MTDDTLPQAATTDNRLRPLAEKEGIGWAYAFMQVVVIGFIYFVVSALFAIPAVLAAVEGGGTDVPELSSATVAWSAIGSMGIAILLVILWLRREGRLKDAIRLQAPADWKSALAWAALGLGATLAIFTAGAPLMEAIGLDAPDAGLVLDLVTESPALFALWVFGVAWFAAGFGEEVLYRGFLTDRLERVPGLRGKVWPVILIQGVLFGLPHAYQGLGGMIVTACVGILFGWIRLKQNGNLWAVIIAHAAVDTVVMGMAYAEALGWISV